jgi:hypothetical protein
VAILFCPGTFPEHIRLELLQGEKFAFFQKSLGEQGGDLAPADSVTVRWLR